MRKTNALYLKTQRLIAETHRDTEGPTKTHKETHKHTDTQKQTQTQRHTQRDAHTKRHIQRAASKVYPSFCYTHEY